MRSVVLLRSKGSEAGAPGRVFVDGLPFCYSLELEWQNNEPNVSCIPAGEYVCRWHKSPRFGWVFHVTDVTGRTWILIHPGNWAGRRAVGLRSDVYGCILFGMKCGVLAGQRAVLASRLAVSRFAAAMGRQAFKLIILDGSNA